MNERPQNKGGTENSSSRREKSEGSPYLPWDAERLAKLRAERDELVRKLQSRGKRSSY